MFWSIQNKDIFNGKISGIWRGHRVLRTSWTRNVWDQQPGVCGHIGSGCPWWLSCSVHQHVFGSRQPGTWPEPVWWRRSVQCDHHPSREFGCRHQQNDPCRGVRLAPGACTGVPWAQPKKNMIGLSNGEHRYNLDMKTWSSRLSKLSTSVGHEHLKYN